MAIGPSTSQTPYIVQSEPNVRFTSILSTGDSVGGYRMVGVPDGLGAFSNGNGAFTLVMNHELGATVGPAHATGASGAFVSTWVIDATTLRVISGGDAATRAFLSNAAGTSWTEATTTWNRFCSGDFAGVNAFYDTATGLGTTASIYLTGEEAGAEGRAFGFVLSGAEQGRTYELAALGNTSFENVVASPASGAKTVVMMMDDTSPGGQVYFYIGDKQATGNEVQKAGLTNGQLYGIKVAGLTNETSAVSVPNKVANFELAGLGNVSGLTGAQIDTASDAAGVTKFFRPEDGAWDPTHPNWFYFVTTGDITSNSRLYRLEFNNIQNPGAGGTIRVLLDGSEGQRMLDNLTVDNNGHVIIQEDPGNNVRLAKVWDYDPSSGLFTEVGQHDPLRFLQTVAPFNQDEESSGVINVTSLIGGGSQAYLLDVQAHYSNADPSLVEGGQLMAMFIDPLCQTTTGSDTLNGGAGQETIFGGDGNDTVRGGSSSDLLNGDAGDDTVNGNRGADSVYGGDGNDWLYGGKDNDQLRGQAGADTLSGDLGDDLLFGGAGADRFVMRAGDGFDWIGDWNAAEGDKVVLGLGTSYTVATVSSQLVLALAGGAQIGFAGVAASAFSSDWVVFA